MTRILIISDIHANLTALEAVLADAGDVDETWCLGDLVGYGPDPNECVERVRALPSLTCLMGNHDGAVADHLPLGAFNSDARKSLIWQRKTLTPENLDFLRGLPKDLQTRGETSLAHGSPRDPLWEYVLTTLIARLNLMDIQSPWCFVGHSHYQVIFEWDTRTDNMEIIAPEPGSPRAMNGRAILNPGSVGQPRDRDPRAAYALFDPEKKTWEPRRVVYDIKAVQARIRAVGLPPRHAERLGGGW